MMTDLLEGICKKLNEIEPDYNIYLEDVEEGFKRPAFAVVYVSGDIQPVNKFINFIKIYFTIIIYLSCDSYYNSSLIKLSEEQYKIMNAFSDGILDLKDRSVFISSSTGGIDTNMNAAFLDIEITYFDERPQKKEEYDIARHVYTKIKRS